MIFWVENKKSYSLSKVMSSLINPFIIKTLVSECPPSVSPSKGRRASNSTFILSSTLCFQDSFDQNITKPEILKSLKIKRNLVKERMCRAYNLLPKVSLIHWSKRIRRNLNNFLILNWRQIRVEIINRVLFLTIFNHFVMKVRSSRFSSTSNQSN